MKWNEEECDFFIERLKRVAVCVHQLHKKMWAYFAHPQDVPNITSISIPNFCTLVVFEYLFTEEIAHGAFFFALILDALCSLF